MIRARMVEEAIDWQAARRKVEAGVLSRAPNVPRIRLSFGTRV
jgi:hypothetical protein